MQTIKELKDLRAHIDSVIQESEKVEAQRSKKSLKNYNTGLKLLESVSKIIEKCSYSDSGVVEFAKQYQNALMDPDGPREERIYETFIEGLDDYMFLNPVQTIANTLKNRVRKNKQNIDIVELLDIMKDSTSFYIVEHIEDAVIKYMDNNNAATRTELLNTLTPYMFDPFVKQIYSMVESNMTKEQYVNESYKLDKTLESMETVNDIVAYDVVTPVVALDSTRSAIKLGYKWVQLQGRTFSELDSIADVSDEEYTLGKLLDEQDKVYMDINRNQIFYSLTGDIKNDPNPVVITDVNNIVFEDQTYTTDEFALINEARIDALQLVDINNIIIIAKHFDDLAYLDNTIEYNNPNDTTRSLKVFITTFYNGADDSDDQYSLIISNALDSTYEIYNNVSELEVVNLLNEKLDLSIVAITESSKGCLDDKRAKFVKECRAYESKLKGLKSKQAKLESLMTEFDSEDLEESIKSIKEDIEELEKEYAKYQDRFGRAVQQNRPNIKDITFQNKVEPEDVSEPLTDDESEESPYVSSLDVEPGDDEMQYETVPDEYDNSAEFDYYNDEDNFDNSDNTSVDTSVDPYKPYNPDSFSDSVDSGDFSSDSTYPSRGDNDYCSNGEACVDGESGVCDEDNKTDINVYFDKDLTGSANGTLKGKVTIAYPVIANSDMGEVKETIKTTDAEFEVVSNTGSPIKDIVLKSYTLDTLPKNIYVDVINKIACCDEYISNRDFDNQVHSASNLADILKDPNFEREVSTNVNLEGPIKSFVIEGVQNGKKMTRKFINESYTPKELKEERLANGLEDYDAELDNAMNNVFSRSTKSRGYKRYEQLPENQEDIDDIEDIEETPVDFEADDNTILKYINDEDPAFISEVADGGIFIDEDTKLLDDSELGEDEDMHVLYDIDYLVVNQYADSDSDDTVSTYVMRINYDNDLEQNEAFRDLYNKPYAIMTSSEHQVKSDILDFMLDVAMGHYSEEELSDMVVKDIDSLEEVSSDPNFYMALVPVEGDSLDKVVSMNFKNSEFYEEEPTEEDDIDLDDIDAMYDEQFGEDPSDEDEDYSEYYTPSSNSEVSEDEDEDLGLDESVKLILDKNKFVEDKEDDILTDESDESIKANPELKPEEEEDKDKKEEEDKEDSEKEEDKEGQEDKE